MFVAHKTLRLSVQVVLDRKASFIAFAHVGRLDEKKKKRGKEKEKKNLKQMSKEREGESFKWDKCQLTEEVVSANFARLS